MPRTQSGGKQCDAIDMLIQDHKRVQKLFKDFEKLARDDGDGVRELVVTACIELQIHALLEEEFFYPAVRAQLPDSEKHEDLLNEAEVEHESADAIIEKLHELDAADPMYAAYFTVLAEYVRHHIKEEEKMLFPEVRHMSNLDLEQLGEDMRRRRDELFAEMESGESEIVPAREAASAQDAPTLSAEEEEAEDEQERIDLSKTRH